MRITKHHTACISVAIAILLSRHGSAFDDSIVNQHSNVKRIESKRYSATPVVNNSAKGWNLRVTAKEGGAQYRTTVVSPTGKTFDAGYIGVPDIHRPTLWILNVKPLKAQFLMVYLMPVASGPSSLTLFQLKKGAIVTRSARVDHHFEWDSKTKPAYIVKKLFVDSDRDGKSELIENDVGKFGGTITYYEFDRSRFRPKWRERYKLNEHDKIRLIRREAVEKK